MTPREAGEIETEEPDWRERFEAHKLRFVDPVGWLTQERAFESTLRDWRRFHFTWIEVGGEAKRNPAGAPEGIIALAKLGIMPPRFTIKDVPRSDACGYQCDEHMWLSIRGEQWRITGVESRMLCLEQGFEAKPETMQINLTTAKWGKYISAAVEAMGYELKNQQKD